MPFFRHVARRSHCFVGLDSAFCAWPAKCSHSLFASLTFLLMSSATFSALRLVFTNTRACLPIARVSKTRFSEGSEKPASIFTALAIKRQKERVYKSFTYKTTRYSERFNFRRINLKELLGGSYCFLLIKTFAGVEETRKEFGMGPDINRNAGINKWHKCVISLIFLLTRTCRRENSR